MELAEMRGFFEASASRCRAHHQLTYLGATEGLSSSPFRHRTIRKSHSRTKSRTSALPLWPQPGTWNRLAPFASRDITELAAHW